MNCDNRESVTAERCRRKARVRVIYDTGRDMTFTTVKCWPHYLALEERARWPGATFHILKAEAIS